MASNDLDHINTELKKELSSLIISSAKGLTVRRLRIDYREFFGSDVPFRKLGYNYFEQYLLSIPNTCRLIGTGDDALVVPVVNEKNKHINDMILKQKPPKSNSRYRPPRRSRGIYNMKYEPRPPPRPIVPFKLPVLNPNSHKVLLPPPHDYLLSLRRENRTTKNFNFNSNPQINQRVSYTQINQQVSNNLQINHQISNNSQINHQVFNNPQINHQVSNIPQINHHVSNNSQINHQVSNNSQINHQVSNNSQINHQVSDSCDSRLNSNNSCDEIYNIEEPSTSGLQTIELNKLKDENSYKPSDNSKPFTSFDSDDDSDADFYQELGFSEDEDFCYKSEDDEDVTTCVRNLQLKDDQPYLVDLPIVEEPHVSRVNIKVKEKLRELIADYPDGIWCSKLLRFYEQKFKQKLDPLNFGFSSVIQMCDDLPDVFYCIRPNRMDWKLYDKTKPIPDIHSMRDFSKYLQTLPLAQDTRSNTEPALPTDIMYTSPAYKYPEDVLNPGEVINRQWLVNYEKPGDYIELVISEVYDPSKFWIQLKGSTTSEALSKLMDDMQVYYMHQAGTLQLNEFSVRIGLMCAALFMNEFHRAIVIKVFDDQTIKVFYVDYGTVAQVQLKRTCFLHRDFAELPMQAVRARLANIIPKEANTMWPRSASNYMLQLIMEKDLIAYITSIDLEQKILQLVVTDTTMPDVDIHINDMLIEKGFAILGNEAPICESSSALVPNVHLYPSFEELENFVYPSVSDVIMMLKLGHTYETIFDGYFATPANTSHPHNYSDLNHSRSSTSIEKASQGVSAEPEDNFPEEEVNSEEQENCKEQVNCEDQANCAEAEHNLDETENVETVSNEEEISSVSDIEEEENEMEEEIPPEESYKPQESPNLNFPEVPPNLNCPMPPANLKCPKPPPGFKSCPPGFENVRPQNFSGNQFVNMFRSEPTIPLLPNPAYNVNHLTGYPLSFSNYPLMNPNLDPAYNLLLSNPVMYNQLNQLMINQQREALQREAMIQTVQQVKLIEELERVKALNQQQHYARMNQAANRLTQNSNGSNTTQNSESDLPSYRMNSAQTNTHRHASNNDFHITPNVNEDKESISNISEHICDRFVVKLKLKDCTTVHVLRIEGELYVVSQEIISNLLKCDLPLKTWLRAVNLDMNSFPNKLVNLLDYEIVYNQIKSYCIPGVNAPTNLGCNVRLTPLNDVANIVKQFGNMNILSDLKAGITHVTERTDMWKVLDSSD